MFYQIFNPVFQPLKQWLDNLEVSNTQQAQIICKIIPANCPFARDIQLFGYQIIRIPPLCQLNPVYNELVYLRFRSLCYLTEQS